ncbi:MAG: hypothetical protein K6A89_06870, partial [Treponema sp.]|nr:hypothetical protein [Treponema sp.]
MKKNLLALFALISLFTLTPCYSEKKTENKLSVEQAVEIYNNGDKERAKEIFLELSKKGDYNADFELFYRYINTPEDSYKYLRNAAINGHKEAMDYFLNMTIYSAETFKRSNPKDALIVYKEYMKKAKKENDEKALNKLDFITKCAEVPTLNAREFCEKYGLLYEDNEIQNECYYIWQLAEEASREDGRFGKPDPTLILQLIICGGFVPAETTSAINEFYEYYKKGEVHEFKIENFVTSGFGINFCSMRDQERKDNLFNERINTLKKSIKIDNQECFENSITAYFTFIDTKIWKEECHDGSGYITWALASSNKQKNELLEYIEQLFANSTPASNNKNISELTFELNQLIEKRNALTPSEDGSLIQGPKFSVSLDDMKNVDSLWQTYKDNMSEFIRLQFGSENCEEINKWILQK